MTATAEIKAASYLGPVAIASTTNGALQGVVRYATAATVLSAALPTKSAEGIGRGTLTPIVLQSKYMDVKNESSSNGLNFAFGIGSAPALTYGAVNTFANITAAAGWHLSPGETKSVIVPPGATHVSWINSGSGTDPIAFYCSSGDIGDK